MMLCVTIEHNSLGYGANTPSFYAPQPQLLPQPQPDEGSAAGFLAEAITL